MLTISPRQATSRVMATRNPTIRAHAGVAEILLAASARHADRFPRADGLSFDVLEGDGLIAAAVGFSGTAELSGGIREFGGAWHGQLQCTDRRFMSTFALSKVLSSTVSSQNSVSADQIRWVFKSFLGSGSTKYLFCQSHYEQRIKP